MLEKLDLPQSLLRFLFRHRLRQSFAFFTKNHVFVADFPNHGSRPIEEKNLREARRLKRSRDLSRMLQPFFALAQTKTTNYSLVVVMPSGPLMMMFADPIGAVFVPPRAVVPRMMVVPIAVGAAPVIVGLGPFGMMPVDPAGVIVMPPIGIVPSTMFVPITIMMLGMGDHRRSCE